MLVAQGGTLLLVDTSMQLLSVVSDSEKERAVSKREL